MELSGFALVMSELDGAGIWPDVRALWDGILSGDTAPALAGHLSTVIAAPENLFALTPGGIGRTETKAGPGQAPERARPREPPWYVGRSGRNRTGKPRRRRIRSMGPGFIQPELTDLFIVEYLKQRPDMTDLQIPRGAERLQESLDGYRRRMERAPDTIEADEEP